MPILTMFGHVEIHRAIGASIVSVIVCSCGGAAPFLENAMTNVRLAIVLETATTIGALTGVLLAGIVPSSCLYALFTAILFLSARLLFERARVKATGVVYEISEVHVHKLKNGKVVQSTVFEDTAPIIAALQGDRK